MKIEMEQEFSYPLSLVLQAREERFQLADKIQGLKPQNVLVRKESRDKIYTEREFEVGRYGVPPPLEKFLSEDLFTMKECATFDKKRALHAFEIVPRKFKENFIWRGEIAYKEDKKTKKAKRFITATIEVKIPVFGKGLEKSIEKGFVRSMEKDFRTIEEACRLLSKKTSR